MGCCSSSTADRIKLLSEKQQHHIAECCQAALLQAVPDQAFQWIVTKLSRDMGKSQAQIFKMITTDTQPCGRIANKPDQVDGNRSLLQIFGSCEKKAKMFVMAKCEDDLKRSAKLELKTDEDVHDFVVAAVHSEIRKALEDRIDEILNPEGAGVCDGNENNENENENENGENGMKRQKSGSNLKLTNAQKSNTSSVEPTGTHHDDKPAVSKAQQQQQQTKKNNNSTAATSKTNNNSNNTAASNKKNTTKASSTSASYANTKSSSASAARARQNIVQQKQKGDPPKQSGPTHKDNKWVACEDCEYYWNEYKELYYDPVKKLFYNEEIGKWLKTEPTVVVKK